MIPCRYIDEVSLPPDGGSKESAKWINCSNCGHRWKKRKSKPAECPKCYKTINYEKAALHLS